VSLTIVTDVTAEPVELDEQKLHLRLDGDDSDSNIASCIKSARQWIEGQTKRAIMDQTWNYSIDYAWPVKHGDRRIDFPLNPVTAQASPSTIVITYVDTDGATQTLAQTQYTVVGRRSGSFIVPAYNITWPDVRWVPNAITVRFQCGDSGNVPQELHRAVMILAGGYFEDPDAKEDWHKRIEPLISPFRAVTFR
jgi:uncharacterized phiE125 gp8 family phage protein